METKKDHKLEIIEPVDGAHTDALAIDFTWNPLDPGDTFRIQIAKDKGFKNLVFESNPINSDRFTLFDTLHPDGAIYYWRLASHQDGKWTWSTIRSFIADNYKEIIAFTAPVKTSQKEGVKKELSPLASWTSHEITVTSTAQAWGVFFMVLSMLIGMAAILLSQ